MKALALLDLAKGVSSPQLWWHFAAHDIKQRFRRSVLGPFWFTLSLGVMVLALSLVFSNLFNQPLDKFVPYLSTGLIFWSLLSITLVEGSTTFIDSHTFIKNTSIPLSVYFYRTLARNVIIWLHNIVVLFAIFVFFGVEFNYFTLLFFPGFLLLLAIIGMLGLIFGVVSSRYRDFPPFITSVLQVVFFLTPIFWSMDSIPNRPGFLTYNPFYHMLEIVRAPLLGQSPAPESWILCMCVAIILAPLTTWLYCRGYSRIAYWV